MKYMINYLTEREVQLIKDALNHFAQLNDPTGEHLELLKKLQSNTRVQDSKTKQGYIK